MTDIKQLKTFGIIFFSLFFLYLWDGFLSGNEVQTLSNIYHFAHPDWLANDWFLNLDTAYRNVFNILFYIPAKFLPIPALALFCRIVLTFITSAALTKFFSLFKFSQTAILLFVIITYRMKGMLAGEDMFWHVESKVLAYALVVFGISELLQNHYRAMWLFLGGATAFHPLIGGYSVISLIFVLFFSEKNNRINIIKRGPLFLLTAWPGLLVIIRNLYNRPNDQSRFIDLLYVARHPHHMNPASFIRHIHKGFPEWVDLTIIISNVLFCVIILVLAWKLTRRNSKERLLYFYTLGSVTIFIGGIVLYLSGNYHLLKYYPFRFPDVIVPFFAYFFLFQVLDKIVFQKFPKIFQKYFIIALFLIIGGLFIVETVKRIQWDAPMELYGDSEEKIELYTWIRNNTPEDAVFIINPELDNLYFTSNRAQFVNLKNIPQGEGMVLEWYQRLLALNKNEDLYLEGRNLNVERLRKNYLMLTDEELKMIKKQWDLDFYIGKPQREGSLQAVYKNSILAVYVLE